MSAPAAQVVPIVHSGPLLAERRLEYRQVIDLLRRVGP